MLEYTFSMIKPDATKRNLIGAINSRLEKVGLQIVAQKMKILTPDEARKFYAEHSSRSFFDDMVKVITSGAVVLQVLKGKGAILLNRNIMGATNPSDAEQGTIRKDFGIDIEKNSIHGSDSPTSAAREISFFFAGNEICL